MVRLYSVAQMQDAERRAGTEHGISLSALMDAAGKGLARVARSMMGSPHDAVWVFCGSGNNGGDGYVCARELRLEGVDATVCAAGSVATEGLASAAAESYRAAGGQILAAEDLTSINAGLIVDCLLGTGLSRPVTGTYARLIEAINASPAPVLACDVPSGVNADDGRIMGLAVRADRTLMMGLAKPACVLPPGCECFGGIEVCDIGLPPSLVATVIPFDPPHE